MTNNFEKMMEQMMEQMMMKTMEKMFAQMMGVSDTPTVANAEVATATKKAPNTISKEDFLALSEETEEEVSVELDFVVFGSRTARYNRSVASDLWIINHLAITKNYGGKWSKRNGGYVFETPAELRNFLASYQIKQTISSEADKKAVADYKKERAAKRAEYYANLAK